MKTQISNVIGFKKSRRYDVSEEKLCASDELVKTWQKVKVLLWKMYILRKRHWIITLLEIFVPITVFWLVIHFKNLLPEEEIVVLDHSPIDYSNFSVWGNYKIAYTPSNEFTDIIMNGVSTKLNKSGGNVNLLNLVSKSSEEEVVLWLKQEYASDVKNATKDFLFYNVSPKGVGVIFIEPENIGKLKYILRTTRGSLETNENSLYGEQNGNNIYTYDFSGFTTIQMAIDQAYLSAFHSINVSNTAEIMRLPYVEYTVVDLVQMLLPTIVSLGFTFVMPSLLREVVEEKTSGIKELVKIMGLKPWTNWLSWVVYSLLVYVPVTLVIAGFLTVDSGTGPPVDASFIFVWPLFLLFTFAFLSLIFAISTFFTNGTIAMIAGELVWYGVTILIDTFIVRMPDKYSFFIKLMSCLWPSVALVWGVNTIHNFHKSGHPWTIAKLFDDGAGGGRISVGLAAIMLCVDIVFYGIITWYMDNVKPGPYGRAKPLTFIFQRCGKNRYDSNPVSVKKESQKNYEDPLKNTNVGIRIENLRKTFNSHKLVAVENVNLDIYEGNITALLGHNGAGKSTLMSMLAGFFSPTRGRVVVKDKNIFDNMDQFRSSLGLCPQYNLLFSYFTVLEHLIFFGMLKGLSMSQSRQKGKALLEVLSLYDKRNQIVTKLSGGMKRKVALSIALMGDPKVLLLDEPTSGMDPESRRHVWDMLLSTRGQRTTIITTHFMEEADVLGDRIAIMNHGQVSCYGTPMFLKKLYGTGYQLHISKMEQAPVAPITKVVEQHVTGAMLQLSSPSQLSYNIKSEESAQFPALFSALNNSKTELDLIAININCTTMEDVFLRVLAKPEDDTSGNDGIETLDWKPKKVQGCQLRFLQTKALFHKRFLIRMRSWISTYIYMAIPVVLMAACIMKVMEQDYSPIQPKLLISLSSFPRVHVALSSDNQTVGSLMERMITSGQATYESIPVDSDLETYMTEQINSGLVQYERQMIAGFQFNESGLIAAYSMYFDHSSSLVFNMIANTLLQLDSPTSSITVYNHPISVFAKQDICDLTMAAPMHVFNFPLHVIFLSLGLLILSMNCISFPLKERVTNFKQLQLMAGISPFQYWMVIFFSDFMVYLITATLMICMIFIFQEYSILTTSGYLHVVVLILVLFGTSGIPFAYLFSFFVKSSVKATVLFAIFNMAIGTFGGSFLAILDGSYSSYGVWRFFLSFNPLFSATSALVHLLVIMYIDGTCLQCGQDCSTQSPFEFLESGPNTDHPHGIYNFLIFLVVDSAIYFALVLLIEYGIVKKVTFLVSTLWVKPNQGDFEEDLDVKLERDNVFSYHKLQGLVHSPTVLQVYDLGKKYNRKSTAVYGVTFQVEQGECFGLLGVNGAGKTTTFKMLTGEEIPNKGDAYVLELSLWKNKSKFLSLVGYCPQFDAISPMLTGKEMLRVFAQLRGISPVHRDSEVSRWIQVIGLSEYAERPCGTYSGGNKRKLSTAMAFIGSPPVVFLDEPTSGVDPVSRRKLWNIVSSCQRQGQAIVLTSHSMEECEALCSRLTIMVGGQMKCIGSPQYLKHKFGQGYTIKIKLYSSLGQQNTLDELKQQVVAQFRNCTIKDEHLGLLHYHVPDPAIALAELFTKMELLKKKYNIIEDYIVSNTTLEEVFMSFARQQTVQQPSSVTVIK